MSGRFGELLVKSGLVDEAQIAAARAQCPDVRLGSALIIRRVVAPELVNRALAQHLGLTPLRLSALEDCDPAARALIPEALARRLHAVVIAITGTGSGRALLVAMRDPHDLSAVDELTFAAGMKIDARIAPEIYLRAALERGGGPVDSDDDAAPGASSPAAPAAGGGAGNAAGPGTRGRSPAMRPAVSPAPIASTLLLGPDPHGPSIATRGLVSLVKVAIFAVLLVAGVYGYQTCFAGNTRAVGTHYASKALDLAIDFPDNGWRVAPAVGKKVTTARAEYFYRGNAPEFPVVGMLLVRSSSKQAAAAAAETLIGTVVRNPRLRGCEASDARAGAIMCIGAGALELFGMVKGIIATVEVHAWLIGPDVILAAMIQPDKTTTETKQILGSITNR